MTTTSLSLLVMESGEPGIRKYWPHKLQYSPYCSPNVRMFILSFSLEASCKSIMFIEKAIGPFKLVLSGT